jgi:hypothetical protein
LKTKKPKNILSDRGNLEDSMETYEIRILRIDGKPAVITEQKY